MNNSLKIILCLIVFWAIISRNLLFFVDLENRYSRDQFDLMRSASTALAVGGTILTHLLLRTRIGFRWVLTGFQVRHLLVLFTATTATILLLDIGTSTSATRFFGVFFRAFAEQLVVFVPIAVLLNRPKGLIWAIIGFLIFIYSHGNGFELSIVFSCALLLPTLFRILIDGNIWYGVIYHFIYNLGVTSNLHRLHYTDTGLQLWFVLIWLFSLGLIFSADNTKTKNAKLLSRVFPNYILASLAAILTVSARLPVLIFSGLNYTCDTYYLVRNNIQYHSVMRKRRRLFSSQRNQSTQHISPESVPNLEAAKAIVFWHSNTYPDDLLSVFSSMKAERDVVVLRRVWDHEFETMIVKVGLSFGMNVCFIHDQFEYRRAAKTINLKDSLWVFGGEFLVRQNDPSSDFLKRKLGQFSAKVVMMHQPWEIPENRWKSSENMTPLNTVMLAYVRLGELRKQLLIRYESVAPSTS
jgi:hypothetical protein